MRGCHWQYWHVQRRVVRVIVRLLIWFFELLPLCRVRAGRFRINYNDRRRFDKSTVHILFRVIPGQQTETGTITGRPSLKRDKLTPVGTPRRLWNPGNRTLRLTHRVTRRFRKYCIYTSTVIIRSSIAFEWSSTLSWRVSFSHVRQGSRKKREALHYGIYR